MKKLLMIWAVLLGISCLTVGIGSAATWTVCSSGCTSTTVQGAIDAVATSNGDTIKVSAGTYNETVTVNKSLTIKGHSVNDTFIKGTAGDGVLIIAPNVNLSNLNIRGDSTGSWSCGILVGGADVTDAVNHNVSGVVIQKCIVERTAIGIYVWRSTGTKLMNNIVRYCPYNGGKGMGIYVTSDGSFDILNTIITGNKIYDCDAYGIIVYAAGASCNGLLITNNTLYNNGAFDTVAPGNNNSSAFQFNNTLGTITVSNNKVLALSTSTDEFVVSGPVPGIVGANNKIYPNIKPATLSGPATTLVVP
jgi:parallel beta-helix repeat protein